jgi:hypothetical protein
MRKFHSIWSPKKWLAIIGILFTTHVVAIFIFADHPAPVFTGAGEPWIQLIHRSVTSTQIAKSYFSSDPTLFSSLSKHSYSGPAWLRINNPVSNTFPELPATISWLQPATNRLGLGMLPKTGSTPRAPEQIANPAIGPLVRTDFPTNSTARVAGEPALRALTPVINLHPWTLADVLKNSEIEIAVDANGCVVAAHILPQGRSGLADADREALDMARKLVFTPIRNDRIVWGRLIVEWRTVAPPPAPQTPAVSAQPSV